MVANVNMCRLAQHSIRLSLFEDLRDRKTRFDCEVDAFSLERMKRRPNLNVVRVGNIQHVVLPK